MSTIYNGFCGVFSPDNRTGGPTSLTIDDHSIAALDDDFKLIPMPMTRKQKAKRKKLQK